MEFTNETIAIAALPKFEKVQFSRLHKNYLKVIYFNMAITLLFFAIGIILLLYINEDLQSSLIFTVFGISYFVFAVLLIAGQIASFNKRAFAIREKDILYRRGIFATTTTIIPFNRIQHVAMHQGIFSRMYGLAQIQIFTAGGSSSDMRISGIEKEKAESIKELLTQQIQNQD